ncbi:unnamed protein product [Amoebophrya sp. A25]|nr:unnamed protein product [Amoebophrya sp. A25]|eukprot:GSA25T00007069001.1
MHVGEGPASSASSSSSKKNKMLEHSDSTMDALTSRMRSTGSRSSKETRRHQIFATSSTQHQTISFSAKKMMTSSSSFRASSKHLFGLLSSLLLLLFTSSALALHMRKIEKQPTFNYDDLKFSVFRIKSVSPEFDFMRPFDMARNGVSLGSGFLVRSQSPDTSPDANDGDTKFDPLVITNAHVVSNAVSVKLQLLVLGDESYEAETVQICADLDIALLRFKDPQAFQKALSSSEPSIQLLPLQFTEETPPMGSKVLALGFPLGQNLPKLTAGEISGNQEVDGNICFQSTAPISPGNSGGPLLLEENKKVVGINFAKAGGGENVNYVIPFWRVEESIGLYDYNNERRKGGAKVPTRNQIRIPRTEIRVAFGNKAIYDLDPKCNSTGVLITEIDDRSFFKNAKPLPSVGTYLVKIGDSMVDKFGQGKQQKYLADQMSFENLFFLQGDKTKCTTCGTACPDCNALFKDVDFYTCSDGNMQKHTVSLQWDENYDKGIRYIPEPAFAKDDLKYVMFGDISLMDMTANLVSQLSPQLPTISRWLLPKEIVTPHLAVNWIRSGSDAGEVLVPGMVVQRLNGCVVKNIEDFKKFFVPRLARLSDCGTKTISDSERGSTGAASSSFVTSTTAAASSSRDGSSTAGPDSTPSAGGAGRSSTDAASTDGGLYVGGRIGGDPITTGSPANPTTPANGSPGTTTTTSDGATRGDGSSTPAGTQSRASTPGAATSGVQTRGQDSSSSTAGAQSRAATTTGNSQARAAESTTPAGTVSTGPVSTTSPAASSGQDDSTTPASSSSMMLLEKSSSTHMAQRYHTALQAKARAMDPEEIMDNIWSIETDLGVFYAVRFNETIAEQVNSFCESPAFASAPISETVLRALLAIPADKIQVDAACRAQVEQMLNGGGIQSLNSTSPVASLLAHSGSELELQEQPSQLLLKQERAVIKGRFAQEAQQTEDTEYEAEEGSSEAGSDKDNVVKKVDKKGVVASSKKDIKKKDASKKSSVAVKKAVLDTSGGNKNTSSSKSASSKLEKKVEAKKADAKKAVEGVKNWKEAARALAGAKHDGRSSESMSHARTPLQAATTDVLKEAKALQDEKKVLASSANKKKSEAGKGKKASSSEAKKASSSEAKKASSSSSKKSSAAVVDEKKAAAPARNKLLKKHTPAADDVVKKSSSSSSKKLSTSSSSKHDKKSDKPAAFVQHDKKILDAVFQPISSVVNSLFSSGAHHNSELGGSASHSHGEPVVEMTMKSAGPLSVFKDAYGRLRTSNFDPDTFA